MAWRLRVVVVALAAMACEGNPAGPSIERYRLPRILSSCTTSGAQVTCTATLRDVPRFRDQQDVTATASWSVSPEGIGRFSAPGILTPLSSGEATIRVQYRDWGLSDPPTFLVGPDRDARRVYFFSPTVRETGTAINVAGAAVEILDGYAAGRSCVTNSSGFCSIDRVLTGESFTGRVTKNGYASATFTYRVDPPVGPGGTGPFFLLSLQRSDR